VKVVAGWVAALLTVIGLAVGILAVIGVGQPVHVAIRPVQRPKIPVWDLPGTWLIPTATYPPSSSVPPVIVPPPSTTAPPPSDAYNTSLENLVAGGSSRTVTFRVPPGKDFSVNSLALAGVGTGHGVVMVQMLAPDSHPQTLVEDDLARLAEQPFTTIPLQTPIVFDAGDSLGLNVTCQGHEACDVGLLVTGFLVKA
jgi:hypothetical protein